MGFEGNIKEGSGAGLAGHSPFPIPHSPLVVGLVGGIGAGKSQVAEAFARAAPG